MTDFPAFERYRGLIEPFDDFIAAIERPLPKCIWANPSRIDRDTLKERLERQGLTSRPSKLHPWALILDNPEAAPGNTLEYQLGLYHVQEEVAMTACMALDPQPGARVLDMCAAPGNKTALAAAMMGNRGTIVANELKTARLAGLRYNLERLGIGIVAISHLNGSGIPLRVGPFDAIMVDAPCSCEGTVRRFPNVGSGMTERLRQRIARTQGHILQRGLRLMRKGGTLVYSTCTFAPEENEMVLQAVLDPKDRIVPFETPGFVGHPGLQQWQGQTLRDDMVHTRRYYPHDNDSGGFFVARIEVNAP